jgi:hypothetical protein
MLDVFICTSRTAAIYKLSIYKLHKICLRRLCREDELKFAVFADV